MEGVSFDKSSDEDDSQVVEQSLIQLYADSSSENSDDNENHSDLHVLVLEPGNMLEEADVIMTEVNAPCAQVEKCLAPSQIEPSSASSAVSHLSADTSISLREAIESSVGSLGFSSDYAALSPSDVALLDGPDPKTSDSSLKIPKVEENPFSPDPLEMDTEMWGGGAVYLPFSLMVHFSVEGSLPQSCIAIKSCSAQQPTEAVECYTIRISGAKLYLYIYI